MITTELQKQLEAKAVEELTTLYWTQIKAFYENFKSTFHLTPQIIKATPEIQAIYNLCYGVGSTTVIAALTPNYTAHYIADFISKVEDLTNMLD